VTYDFIEPLPVAKKGSHRKRPQSDKPSKPCKPRKAQPASFTDREGGFGDDGGSLEHDGARLGHDGSSLAHDRVSHGDDGGGLGDNGGSFGDCSPEKARDIIDWSITSNEVERLKSQVVPLYWELLLESVNSIVRVTERLYILQDWDNKGYLKVTSQSIILIFEGTPVQACLQNGRYQRADGDIMRLSTDA
jgi:hypothetical protein